MGLFARRTRLLQNDVLDTVIGPSATWCGTLRSDGGVRVEGRFEGCIEVAGNVVVTESGMVDGNIVARDVVIGGIVRGDVEGAGRLEVLSTGQLIGDITVASFMIDEGGIFEGISRLQGAASARMKALPAPLEAAPELPDVVIAVGRAKGNANGTGRGTVQRRNGANSDRAAGPEAAVAANGTGTADFASEAELESAQESAPVAEIIEPARQVPDVSAARAAASPSEIDGEGLDAFLSGLDLDIEPIIPEAASSNGAHGASRSAANGDGDKAANGKAAARSGSTTSSRTPRGASKSSQRRARSRNGTSA